MTGERLKYEIRKRGYTIRRLATRMGTSPQNMGNKLASDDIATSIIEAAADMMDISPAELYGGGDTIQATAAYATAFKGTNHCDPRLIDIIRRQTEAIAGIQRQQQQIIRMLTTGEYPDDDTYEDNNQQAAARK